MQPYSCCVSGAAEGLLPVGGRGAGFPTVKTTSAMWGFWDHHNQPGFERRNGKQCGSCSTQDARHSLRAMELRDMRQCIHRRGRSCFYAVKFSA
eukprot:1001635-Rhodomonas_salina.1